MYIYFFKIKQDCDVTVLKNIIFHNANINNKSSITLPIPVPPLSLWLLFEE